MTSSGGFVKVPTDEEEERMRKAAEDSQKRREEAKKKREIGLSLGYLSPWGIYGHVWGIRLPGVYTVTCVL
jgi:hypothetical protein